MRAARYYGRGDLRVEDVPEPQVGPGDVKICVDYAGICGSDLHEYYLGPVFTSDEPHPFTGIANPVIIGHELSGVVVDVGDGVTSVCVGDHVTIHGVETCGRCGPCQRGVGRCSQAAIHGYSRDGGAYSEYTVVKERMTYRVPDGVSQRQAALIEPLSVGMTGALRADVRAGETAALHGAGPIGLAVLLALRADGVDVIVSDPSAMRRDAARVLGAAEVIDPAADDVVATIRELTGGDGAAASIDSAGVSAALNAAIQSTADGRRVVIVAMPTQKIELDVMAFHASRTFLATSTSTTPVPESFRRVMDLMVAGHYPLDGWTEAIALDDVVEEGFEPLHRGEKVKVLIDIGAQR